MKVNEKIYNLRKEHNLSQEELADKLNVSRQTISKWELGESTPDFDKIVPICELFGITTEELLRDNKEYRKEVNNSKVDVTKVVLICVSIFLYFLAIIAAVITEEVLGLNEGVVATTFLGITALATVLLVFTLLTRRSKERVEEDDDIRKNNPVAKSVVSIFSLITTFIYLLISFITGAWHITWIIWIAYAVGIEIIKLIFALKGENKDGE